MSRSRGSKSKPPASPGTGAGTGRAGAGGAEHFLPRLIGNRAVASLFHARPDETRADPLEREAATAAGAVVGETAPAVKLRSGPAVQRAPLEESPAAAPPSPAAPAPPQTDTAPAAGPRLILEDDAPDAAAGQMRKSEFLEQVRTAVCGSAEEGLAAGGQSALGCPWIEYWLNYYGGKEAAHVEDSIHRFAPETAAASSAADYIPLIAARVRRGVDEYAKTGEAPRMPDEMPGANMSAGSLLFKARAGGARSTQSPAAIQGRLGPGQPLPGGTRAHMEEAFGSSFARVRVHADSNASSLAGELNARAFTVGRDVAFGAGEFRPGTLMGDALIAHELAHVVQQDEANPAAGRRAADSTHEADADLAAAAAVTSLWAGGGRASIGPRRRKLGLSLQRCGPKKTATAGWTVEGVSKILYDQGDQTTLVDALRKGYKIYRFKTAYDKWKYDDGHEEENELTGLDGNTAEDPATHLKIIRIRESLTDEEAAPTLFHELDHASRPEPADRPEGLEQEIAVRIDEEKFRIRHNMPESEPGYRKADGSVDEAAIRASIMGSPHYNPTGRRRIGRRYVGDEEVTGWKAP